MKSFAEVAVPLDELSKSKLERYVDRAVSDHGHQNMARRNTQGDTSKEFGRKEALRKKGISRAMDRLHPQTTKEEDMPIGNLIPEGMQLDELSSDLLARYKKKASEQSSAQDKEAFASGTSQKRARELLDKSHKRYKGIIKATGKQFSNDMKRYQKEEALLGEEAKHNEVHVSDAGGGKYKVHAVGKKFASGIKVGEHLTDTHLDDVSEMGGKVKMVKAKKD